MQKIEVIRSKRKTISIEIKGDLSVIVRAPLLATDSGIEEFVKSKSGWIEKNVKKMSARMESFKGVPKLEGEELKKVKKQAKNIILQKVIEFSKQIGVQYGKVSFRFQKSKWGSCNAKGSLSFNCLLALCPDEIQNYVIIHELCHIKHLNHSRKFWLEVEKHCKNYKNHRKWLREEGQYLINYIK